ncbi:hypothetical protein NSQ59_27700 [Margalitia sp. FSL K6-0131]|uniref:hypothetical protein n=1 Tax=Margalitia sp. FSL K6-0131 TaxID=2954604 RepID=UPI0030F6FE4F
MVIDSPIPHFPLFLIAYFEDLGYCVYKHLEGTEGEKTTLSDIEKLFGYNKRKSLRKIPKDKIIIEVKYPDFYEYENMTKRFFLFRPNKTDAKSCFDIINYIWGNFEKAMQKLEHIRTI